MRKPSYILGKFRRRLTALGENLTWYDATGTSGYQRTYASGTSVNAIWNSAKDGHSVSVNGEDTEVVFYILVDPDTSISRYDLIERDATTIMQVATKIPVKVKDVVIYQRLDLVHVVVPDSVSLT